MTTFVLVHGAWHGGWAWDRVAPLLPKAVTVDLTHDRDVGLHDHVEELVRLVDATTDPDLVLVGHSYAGLVVRQAADLRPARVAHVVLVEGWAGPSGVSLAELAPEWFMTRVRAAADGWRVPAPPPAMFGITDPDDVRWLAQRLRGHPLRTFTDRTALTGAVDRIPGTGVHCRPAVLPFAQLTKQIGYRAVAMDGPHDVLLSDPRGVADVLLPLRNEKCGA
jgi:pimeloyl-ACP methyl ester carboxylesterase